MASLKLYGAGWCTVTQVVRNHLRMSGVEHDYVDVDEDPCAVANALAHSEQDSRQCSPAVAGGGARATGQCIAAGASAPLSPQGRAAQPRGATGGEAPVHADQPVTEVSASGTAAAFRRRRWS